MLSEDSTQMDILRMHSEGKSLNVMGNYYLTFPFYAIDGKYKEIKLFVKIPR